VPGADDVRVEQVAGLRYLRIDPDRNKLARYGLTVADVNQLAETIAVGHHVGDVLEGERRFGIAVKTAHGYDGDLAALESLPLRSVSNQILPLGDVARLSFSTGPAQISREAQSRRLAVEFNVRGRDLMSVVKDAARAAERVKLPSGYRLEWGGQFRHYEEAKLRLFTIVPLALGLILFALYLALGSFTRALLIFSSVPFSAVGGVVALYLRGIPFSVSSGVGFVALFGVAVLNGLVLVTFARELEKQGLSPDAAIERAARLRLRPVLMTALVASLGFLPMALSTAPGAEVQRPLATVVIGGLVSATLLTLLVLPAAYAVALRRKQASS
jgi:cobalt-zinc-cadmium resistance protein CzcA